MAYMVSMLSWRAAALTVGITANWTHMNWKNPINLVQSHQPNQQNSNIPPPKPRQSSVTTAVAKRLIKKINKWSKLVSLAMRYTSTPQNFIQPCFACKAHGATKQTAGWGFFPQQRNAVANYVDSPSQSYLRTQTGGSSVFRITFSRSCSTNADGELCSASPELKSHKSESLLVLYYSHHVW